MDSDPEDLATVVDLLNGWAVLFRYSLAVGASMGQADHALVNELADALHGQLGSDEMAGALATAIFLLACRE